MAVEISYFCCSDLTTDSQSPYSSTRYNLLQTALVFSEKLYFNLFSELVSSQPPADNWKQRRVSLTGTETRVISCCVPSFNVPRHS